MLDESLLKQARYGILAGFNRLPPNIAVGFQPWVVAIAVVWTQYLSPQYTPLLTRGLIGKSTPAQKPGVTGSMTARTGLNKGEVPKNPRETECLPGVFFAGLWWF